MDDREDLVYQAKLAEQAERYDGESGGHRGAAILGPSAAAHRGRSRRQNGGTVSDPGPGTWIWEAGTGLCFPGAVGGPGPRNLTSSVSSAADAREPKGRGDRAEELVVKWRLWGEGESRGGGGGRAGGCRLRASSPQGSVWPVLGRGALLGGVMEEETPATREGEATGRCSAGSFQGNMAGGGGGLSPEAQCGAAAVESHKGGSLARGGRLCTCGGTVWNEGGGRGEGGSHCSSSAGGGPPRCWPRMPSPLGAGHLVVRSTSPSLGELLQNLPHTRPLSSD